MDKINDIDTLDQMISKVVKRDPQKEIFFPMCKHRYC